MQHIEKQTNVSKRHSCKSLLSYGDLQPNSWFHEGQYLIYKLNKRLIGQNAFQDARPEITHIAYFRALADKKYCTVFKLLPGNILENLSKISSVIPLRVSCFLFRSALHRQCFQATVFPHRNRRNVPQFI